MIELAVCFGERSAEHEISVITALQLIDAIDPRRYHVIPVYVSPTGRWYTGDVLLERRTYRSLPGSLSDATEVLVLPDPTVRGLTVREKPDQVIAIDLFFMAFHGRFGEDGRVQALLDLAEATYTGCGFLSSAVAMNKHLAKVVVQAEGIPTLPSSVVRRDVLQRSGRPNVDLQSYPLFVKPLHLGSSVGVAKAESPDQLMAALCRALSRDFEVLVEPCIQNLMEVNVAVLDGDPPIASVVEVPVPSDDVLTYEDKYMRGGKKGGDREGMASLTRSIDPKNLDQSIKESVTSYALRAFDALDCGGAVRFDFMVDLDLNAIYFNEANPIPGSMAFYLWQKSEPPLLYTELVDRLVDAAFRRRRRSLAMPEKLHLQALS